MTMCQERTCYSNQCLVCLIYTPDGNIITFIFHSNSGLHVSIALKDSIASENNVALFNVLNCSNTSSTHCIIRRLTTNSFLFDYRATETHTAGTIDDNNLHRREHFRFIIIQ